MQRTLIPKSEYQEVKPEFIRGHKQYYFLRVNPIEQEDGQVLAIEELYDHMPTDEDRANLYGAWLSMCKSVKIREIADYDRSEHVNIFEINGESAWLDKATRVGLVNSLRFEQASGYEMSTLYLNDHALTLPISTALDLLQQLEMYALACYRTTEAHKEEVRQMSVIEHVEGYDVKNGYPEHPKFEL